MPVDINTNIGAAMVNLQGLASQHYETLVKDKFVKELQQLNEENRKLTDFISLLTRNKEKGKVDFSDNPEKLKELKELVDYLYPIEPGIFGHELSYEWKDEASINAALGAANHAVQSRMQKSHDLAVQIQMHLEKANLIDKIAKDTLEDHKKLQEHIISHTTRGG